MMIVGKPNSDEGIGDEGDVEDEGLKSGVTPLADLMVVGEKERLWGNDVTNACLLHAICTSFSCMIY